MATLVKSNRHFFPQLPYFFDDFFRNEVYPSRHHKHQVPAVNVKETEEAFELQLAAPGMKKEDFNIELDNNTLTISAEYKQNEEKKDKEGNYTFREFNYQSFRRSFSLSEKAVNGDQITAKYENGILFLNIPKSDYGKVKPVKQIQIS